MRLWKKIVFWIVGLLTVFVILPGIIIFSLWHNEIKTYMSIREIYPENTAHKDGAVYEMHVSGDFYFEEFVNHGGAKNDEEVVAFIKEKMAKGFWDITLAPKEILGSSFTAKTNDGNFLFARNYDAKKGNICLVHTKASDGRHASVSTVDLEFLGIDAETGVQTAKDKLACLAAPYVPLDGINDAGVSCGIFSTYQGDKTVPTNQNTDEPDLTSTTMVRMVLDYADSLEEAVAMISYYDLHDTANNSYHYMIADSTGKSAVLEWIAPTTDLSDNDGSKRELKVYYNEYDAEVGPREEKAEHQWVTNFVLEPGYYDDGGEMEGYDRYENIYMDLKETDGTVKDEDAAMKVLSSVGRRRWVHFDGKDICTLSSMVYNLTDKTALFIPNENYDNKSAAFPLRLEK